VTAVLLLSVALLHARMRPVEAALRE